MKTGCDDTDTSVTRHRTRDEAEPFARWTSVATPANRTGWIPGRADRAGPRTGDGRSARSPDGRDGDPGPGAGRRPPPRGGARPPGAGVGGPAAAGRGPARPPAAPGH